MRENQQAQDKKKRGERTYLTYLLRKRRNSILFYTNGSVNPIYLYHVSITANCQGRASFDGATTSDVCPTECDATSTIEYTKQIIWQ